MSTKGNARRTISKRSKVFLIVLIVITAVFVPVWIIFLPNPFKQGWSGVIMFDTTWEGNIYVTGDIVVVPWATLTIKPGTTITMRVGQDDFNFIQPGEIDDLQVGDPTVDANAGALDYLNTHISFSVYGKIISKGTSEHPITFTSEKPIPTYADWCGIYLNYGEFEYTSLLWSVDGIYANWDYERLTVDHCYIAHSFSAGVGFGSAKDGNTVGYVKHSTIQDCGHEAIDTHSSGNLEIAYNYIDQSQVGLNLREDVVGGELNVNVHHNQIINTGCPVLVHRATVTIDQSVFQITQQDTSRWTYNGWQMTLLQGFGSVNIDPSGSANVLLENSIIYDINPTDIAVQNQEVIPGTSVFGSNYNNFDTVGIDFQGPNVAAGISNTYVGSQFVNVGTGDVHLQAGSPLIGAGNPADGSPDLGVYGGALAEDHIGWLPT
jgi:hypothetical protein